MGGSAILHDDRRVLDRILREVAKLRGAVVTVGVHDDAGLHGDSNQTVAQIAAVHEFGAGRIPERSFLRSTVDGNPQPMIEATKSAAQVCRGNISAQVCADRIGIVTVGAVKETIAKHIPPPLSPVTIQRREEKAKHGGGLASHAGATTPLIDSGQLIQSIQYRAEVG